MTTLARYPVKSMAGERLRQVDVDPRGVVGDRCWAVYTADGGIGSGKTTRRFRRVDGLLTCRARLDGSVPVIELPGGASRRADDPAAAELLGAFIGRPLALRPEGDVAHHDESPVHVITTASLRRLGHVVGATVDERRFRANIVVDADGVDFVEDAWKGHDLRLGEEVVLRVGAAMERCTMVSAAQVDLPRDARILEELAREHELELGVQAHVVHGGRVREGDRVHLLDAPRATNSGGGARLPAG